MLQLTENNKQIGTVNVNTANKFSVGLLNTSLEKITVTNLQPSCGSCTAAIMANGKNEIEPGSTGTVNITFTPNSTAFQTTKSLSIFFTGSDLKQQKIVYSFTAKVI